MNDVSFTFGMEDKVTPVLRRQKAEADSMSKSLRDAGQALSKGGGAIGGIAGRTLGGAGGPFALLAAGAIFASTAIGAANAAMERSNSIIRESVGWQQKLNQAKENGDKARASVAAGGISQAASTRLLLNRGGSIDEARRNTKYGIDLNDSISGESELALNNKDKQGKIRYNARELAMTGEITYTEAVKRLSMQNGSFDLERDLVALRGQLPTPENIANAQQTLFRNHGLFRDGNNEGLSAINNAITNAQGIPITQSEDLIAGFTGRAIQKQNYETQNPTQKLTGDLMDSVNDMRTVLEQTAAHEHMAWAKILDSLAKIGMSSGSEHRKLQDFNVGAKVVYE